jgi:hypothetical protein
MILKFILLLIIVTAGGLSGGFSYYFIRDYQSRFYREEFDNMVQDNILSIRESIFVKLQANLQLSITMGLACPTAAEWPNCALPSQEFADRTHSLVALAHIEQFLFLPLVTPEERQSFETFAAELYLSDGGYPNGTGVSSFGPGIFAVTPEMERYRPPNHTTSSVYDLTVPVLEVNDPHVYSNILLYDAHSDPSMAKTIDAILDCVSRISEEEQKSGEEMPPFYRHSHCGALTDDIPTLSAKYSAISVPIFPSQSQTEAVGLTSALFTWESVLVSTTRHDSSFLCKIQSTTSSTDLLFEVSEGMVKERTRTDVDERRQIGRDARMHQAFVLNDSIFTGETSYTITYYSTGTAPAHYLALITCMCCIGVSVFISVSFEVFNSLIKQETVEVNQLLDSKRVFVRFVSHEIRLCTPSLPTPSPDTSRQDPP